MSPSIYTLARPQFADGFAPFLASEGCSWQSSGGTPAEQLVEFSGRICYMSFGSRQSPKSNREYIQNLIVQGHESVLEHASWTFLLTGVSRAFTHQLVRHRAGFSFSQLSQQYHDETDSTFVTPQNLSPRALNAWTEATRASKQAYNLILSELLAQNRQSKEAMRAIRSAARSVLPNATETKIVVTANARAIRHFLTVRGGIEGDLEMRQVSKLIYDELVKDAPTLVFDFKRETMSDGTPIILKSSS